MNRPNPFDTVVSAIPYSEDLINTVGEVGEDIWEIVLNRGKDDGWSVGNLVLVFALGPEISDPESGESLGHFEIVRGRGKVTHIQSRMCTVRSTRTVMRPANSLLPINAAGEPHMVERNAPFTKVAIGDLVRVLG